MRLITAGDDRQACVQTVVLEVVHDPEPDRGEASGLRDLPVRGEGDMDDVVRVARVIGGELAEMDESADAGEGSSRGPRPPHVGREVG